MNKPGQGTQYKKYDINNASITNLKTQKHKSQTNIIFDWQVMNAVIYLEFTETNGQLSKGTVHLKFIKYDTDNFGSTVNRNDIEFIEITKVH